MASAEDQLIQRGIEKGIEKGVRNAVLRQLRARFGVLDATVERRIAQASAVELDRWIERVVLADRLDDVFVEPASSSD